MLAGGFGSEIPTRLEDSAPLAGFFSGDMAVLVETGQGREQARSLVALCSVGPGTKDHHESAFTSCNIYGRLTTVRLWPITGRRHQLRRHCALLGAPIVGDDLYHTEGLLTATSPLERAQEIERCGRSAGVVLSEHTEAARISVVPKNMTLEKQGKRAHEWDVDSAIHLTEQQTLQFCFSPHAVKAPVRRRVGLFLQAIAIHFVHPVTQGLCSFSCPEVPRFAKLRAKAAKGLRWIEHSSMSEERINTSGT